MSLQKERKPRICILAYKALTHLVRKADMLGRAEIVIDEYTLDDVVLRASEVARDERVDVVVSPDSVAKLLRAQLDVPVVSIEVTGFDLLLALQCARQVSPRVGMVIYQQTLPELDAVKDLLKIELEQSSYATQAEAREFVRTMASRGIQVVVGSSMIVELAEQHGMRGILIYSTDSVERALAEAAMLGESAIRQQSRFDGLNAAFARLHDAILTVDSQHRISAINPLMRQILGLESINPIGMRLPDLSTELSLAGVLNGQEVDIDQVVQLKSGTYLMMRIAIEDRSGQHGAMLTLRDAGSIHRADTSIRSQRRSRSLTARYTLDHIIGTSPALVRARTIAARCALTHSTVLISGETGTGTELFAQAIHNGSARQRGPFVAINCAAFPESLLESELFGYEEGSFTGSRKGGRPGLFEAAHTGTVFLDEIGDMPLSLQTRLLRVLQEREVVRLGSNVPIAIDVRVVAATHRSLHARVAEDAFRADLFYRLNILHIPLPPLRERAEDLPVLALQLLEAKLRSIGSALPAEAALGPLVPDLLGHSWPGNIRELENLMERFAVFLIGLRDPAAIDHAAFLEETPELAAANPDPQLLADTRVLAAMISADGSRQQAAQMLNISRTTLWRRLKEIEATVAASGASK